MVSYNNNISSSRVIITVPINITLDIPTDHLCYKYILYIIL